MVKQDGMMKRDGMKDGMTQVGRTQRTAKTRRTGGASSQRPWVSLGLVTAIALGFPSHLHEGAIAQTPGPALPPVQPSVRLPQLTPTDSRSFERLMQRAGNEAWDALPIGEVMQRIAEEFRGKPYREGLLDRSPTESLVLSLSKFDCVLLIETVLGLAHTAQTTPPPSRNPALFAQEVQQLRYRNGQIDGYCSRLHYFSDWIAANERRGVVKNLTAQLGGIPSGTRLTFMSQHRSSYPPLRSDTTFHCIQHQEARLANLPIDYIPHAKIRGIYRQLQAGDIVAIATAVPGLDVTHTGLVARQNDGRLGLIHASPGGSVKLAHDLANYAANVEDAIGIMVVRPLPHLSRS